MMPAQLAAPVINSVAGCAGVSGERIACVMASPLAKTPPHDSAPTTDLGAAPSSAAGFPSHSGMTRQSCAMTCGCVKQTSVSRNRNWLANARSWARTKVRSTSPWELFMVCVVNPD